jgi:hypothetical protein
VNVSVCMIRLTFWLIRHACRHLPCSSKSWTSFHFHLQPFVSQQESDELSSNRTGMFVSCCIKMYAAYDAAWCRVTFALHLISWLWHLWLTFSWSNEWKWILCWRQAGCVSSLSHSFPSDIHAFISRKQLVSRKIKRIPLSFHYSSPAWRLL